MQISTVNSGLNNNISIQGNTTKQIIDASRKYGPTAVIEAGKIAYPIAKLMHTNQLDVDNFLLFYPLSKIFLMDWGEYCLKYFLTKNNAPDDYYAWSKLNIWAQYRQSKYCKAFANQMEKLDAKVSSFLKNKEQN